METNRNISIFKKGKTKLQFLDMPSWIIKPQIYARKDYYKK